MRKYRDEVLIVLCLRNDVLYLVARQKIRAASAGDFSLSFDLIGSLESPPSNLLKATRKPDVLVLLEIRG